MCALDVRRTVCVFSCFLLLLSSSPALSLSRWLAVGRSVCCAVLCCADAGWYLGRRTLVRIQKGDRASVCVWLNDVEKSISPERRRSGRVHAGWGSNSVVGLSCLSVLSARPVLCSALLCSCALCPCTTAARPPACVRASLGPSSLSPGLSLSSPAAALSLHGRPLGRKGETPCRPASQPAKEKGRKVATRRSARRQKYSPLFFFFFAPRTCPVDDAPPPGCRTYKRKAISRLSDFSPRERRGEIDWVWLVAIWPPHICFFRFFRLFFSFFFLFLYFFLYSFFFLVFFP